LASQQISDADNENRPDNTGGKLFWTKDFQNVLHPRDGSSNNQQQSICSVVNSGDAMKEEERLVLDMGKITELQIKPACKH
jgi:hypothetical protein